MKSPDLVDLFRKEMVDEVGSSDDTSLWVDSEVFGFADDAQKMFCRLTNGITDATSSITKLSVPEGSETVAYDSRILRIKNAYRTSDGAKVNVINQEDMEKLGLRFGGSPGTLQNLVVGMDDENAFPVPVPSSDDDVQLTVERLPLEDITEESTEELEIAKQHHRHLLMWMKSLAYGKQDSECYDRAKSIEYDQRFRAYCGQAKAEQEKRKHKVRVVAYGGLPVGTCGDRSY